MTLPGWGQKVLLLAIIPVPLFLSRIIDTCGRPIQRYTAKTSHIRLPTHLDD